MNAAQARSATHRGIERKRQEEINEQRRAREKQLREDLIAIKGMAPFVRKVESEIKRATNDGKRSVQIQYDNQAVANKIKKALEEDGYKVTFDHYEGYENYGDFNAPCNIWESRSYLIISW